jgi:hypothetical protein
MVQDEGGRWWAKHRDTAKWNYFDGSSWVEGTPPGYEGVAPEPTTDGPPTQSVASPHREGEVGEDGHKRRPWVLMVGLFGIVALIAVVVYLVVSNISGPEMARVPDVVGKPRNEAEKVLKSNGFNVEVKMRQSSEDDAGSVAQQSPFGGGEAKRGSEVAITVGEAPPSPKKPTPEETSRPAPGYNMIQDPTGALTVEVPPSWGVETGEDSEKEAGPNTWSYVAGEYLTSSITTAPNLDAWYSTGTSGAYLVASRALAQGYTDYQLTHSLLNENKNNICTAGPYKDLNRPPYSGKIQTWYECGADGATVFSVAAAPEGRECVVVLNARISDESHRKAIEHLIDTFNVNCSRVA